MFEYLKIVVDTKVSRRNARHVTTDTIIIEHRVTSSNFDIKITRAVSLVLRLNSLNRYIMWKSFQNNFHERIY